MPSPPIAGERLGCATTIHQEMSSLGCRESWPGGMIWFSGALLVIGGMAALLLPKLPGGNAAHSGARPPIVRDWALLFRLAVYRRVLIIAALVEGSHALHDAFSVIRWRSAGIDLPIVGLLWSESVLSEVVVFLLIGPRLVRQFGPGGACALAAGAGVVRWTVAAFTTDPVLLGFVQPLHGLTFALLHLACMRLIVQVVPVRLAATAQSIYGTMCIGLATALLTLASGLLYERMGGNAFLVMAGALFAGAATVRRSTSLESGGVNEANNQTDGAACTTAHASSRPVNLPRRRSQFSMIWQSIDRDAARSIGRQSGAQQPSRCAGFVQWSAVIRPFSGFRCIPTATAQPATWVEIAQPSCDRHQDNPAPCDVL